MSAPIKFLDLYSQYLTIKPEVDIAIESVIRESSFVGGANVSRFERRFAAFQQAECCVAVGNGTDSLEIILKAMNFPKDSEVIVPANSFIASSEAVTNSGYRVVFADINPSTYTLDINDVANRITGRTKAIIAVHLYGHPCEMGALMSLATHYDLKVIEDCAQAHGAEHYGRRVGAIGHAGSFSFYPGKNLGAYGDGGAIVTNDKVLANYCRMIANHGRIDKYDHQFEGRNSRLDGIQAAILNVKLNYLDQWINARNQLASAYFDRLANVQGVVLPVIESRVRHAFHLFVIKVDRREALTLALNDENIQFGIHYPVALPKLRAYEYLGQADESFAAVSLSQQLLSLPIGEHLSIGDVERVCDVICRWSLS